MSQKGKMYMIIYEEFKIFQLKTLFKNVTKYLYHIKYKKQ